MSSLTNIDSFLYKEATNVLSVTYHSGSIWDYHPVNPETYAALIASESLVRSIHSALRAGTVVGIKKVKDS
uniref:Putative RNA binding domain protein n=1 Tax=viral metagenome TaxID=1070528 RepID=A0A6M3IL32_9ZZZZ